MPKARTQTTWGCNLAATLRSLLEAQVLTVGLKVPRMEFESCPLLPFLFAEALRTAKKSPKVRNAL